MASPAQVAPAYRSAVTVPELAAEWGIDPERVRDLIETGALTARNLSKGKQRPRYLISRKVAEDYLAGRTTPADAPAETPADTVDTPQRTHRKRNAPAVETFFP